ncbi:MAG: hypothetical protein Q4C10_08625 [Clostridia bacterium]|nr:hypothetical protein [Clostridia bacterium]
MKKLSLFLALILALACLPAFAAEGDLILGREEGQEIRFDSAFTDGETLYLSNGGMMYTWRPGDAELTEYTYNFGDAEGTITARPFIGDGQLYAFTLKMSYGAHTDLEEAALNRITLEADNTVSFEQVTTLDWSALLEYYDGDVYANMPLDVVVCGGKAYLRHYNDQYDFVLSVLDLETGRMEENDELQDVYALLPYQEGTLLVEQYSYRNPETARLLIYDCDSESVQPLCELEVQSYTALNGLAYDEASDTVYCLKGGEICPLDPRTGEVGAGVADMPLESYGTSHAVLMNGIYAYAGTGLAIRDLVAGSQVAFRLKVVDSNYCTAVTTATTRFGAEHTDVGVTLSRDFRGADNLVESMMNRDDSVDIYTVSTSSAAFDAVYQRGYMMELDRSEALADLAERMYPSLRERLSAYDHFVALPLETYCWGPGFNEKALEALGLTLEDVPDNWWDLLDFLPTLEGPLAEHENVRLTYQGMTVSSMRSDLFFTIFNSYQQYVNAVDPNMGYNTPLLRGLLEKVERIDFEALGCEEDYGEDGGMGGIVIDMGGETMTLFETATNYCIGESYSDATPVMLGLDANTRAPMILDTVVAFVNPFTRHPDEALAYMETLAASMPNTARYNIDPALDEPIRGARNEELLEESRRNLEQLRAQLESADPSEAQLLEESVAEAEEHLAQMEQFWWEIPESSIEWYRAHAEGVVTAPVNWLYANNGGEGYELISQYLAGGISLDELLREIDHKVQMMMMEGN